LKRPGNGLMATMAFKLSFYEGIFSIIINERMIVFYYSEESQLNLIKKVFGYKTKL
jgi:hypothetical protein